MRGSPTAVDFFSGAGGLSEGLIRAGFRVLLALDSDPMALRTYALNHPAVPSNGFSAGTSDTPTRRVAEDARSDRIDVLAGAPPCQGFSHAGFRSKVTQTGYRLGRDDRNFLFEHMVAAALELRPRMFLWRTFRECSRRERRNCRFSKLPRGCWKSAADSRRRSGEPMRPPMGFRRTVSGISWSPPRLGLRRSRSKSIRITGRI